MARQIRIAEDVRGIVLSNGLVLDEGDEAVVSDTEFTRLSALISAGDVLDLGATTDPVLSPETRGITDQQLRAAPVPVSGGLTDAQLRAAPVPVSSSVSGVANASAPAAVTVGTAATVLLAARPERRGLLIQNEHAVNDLYLGLGAAPTTTNGIKIKPGDSFADEIFTGAVHGIGSAAGTDVRVVEVY